jgi:methionyl-tRNA formyltransferase
MTTGAALPGGDGGAGRPGIRVVILTGTSGYAERLLVGLSLAGIVPVGVVINAPASAPASARLKSLARSRSPRRILAAVARRALRMLDPAERRRGALPTLDHWSGFADRVVRVSGLDEPDMYRAMEELSPDLLVVHGVGIVKEKLLRIPRIGTINAHPALLPWVRGSGVVARSVQQGVPVGVTVHFVDPGIDTGAVIQRELVPVTAIDTLRTLSLKADARCVSMLVEVISSACEGAELKGVPQGSRYPLNRWAGAEETEEVGKLVEGGAALRAFEEWRKQAGSNRLPDGFELVPAGINSQKPTAKS